MSSGLLGIRPLGFGGLPPVRPALQPKTQEVTTQLRSLPAITGTLGPADRMETGLRQEILNLAYASGNPFSARQAIKEASDKRG